MAADSLPQYLRRQLHGVTAPLCVALSGGGDSTALLHALAQYAPARTLGLRAIHVNHGLHAHSEPWAQRCRTLCRSLQIPLSVYAVRVDARGEGMEAAARKVRYRALAAQLAKGEWLLTAHHRDDQAETVLLKLLRGAGPQGLAAMRERRPLGQGMLWRPLLALPRALLRAYLETCGLAAIDDPSNADPALARGFLRLHILPALRQHWPQAQRILAHAATLQSAAADFIDSQADSALSRLHQADDSLDAAGWLNLHAALRAPVLERWLHRLGLPAPSGAPRRELERQGATAAADRIPHIRWCGACVRLWRGHLYALREHHDPPPHWRAHWHGEHLDLPSGCGRLSWRADSAEHDYLHRPITPVLQVRLGIQGLRFKPAGDRHTRKLRDLLQQAAVPPWMRRRCPLLFDSHGTLLAVADLWQTDAGKALFEQCGRHPQWQRQA